MGKWRLFGVGIVLVIFSGVALCQVVTIGFRGVIDYTYYGMEATPYLEGDIGVGEIISGYYVYDTLAVDEVDGNIWHGRYSFTQLPFGMYAEINGHVFQTDASQVDFRMELIDADLAGYATRDGYLARSYNNTYNYSEVAGGTFGLIEFDVNLDAPYGLPCDAVVGDSLPSTGPDLTEFENKFFYLHMNLVGDFESHGGSVAIRAEITDMWVVPEPGMLGLVGFGWLMLRRRVGVGGLTAGFPPARE
jgi:hypothetical protein